MIFFEALNTAKKPAGNKTFANPRNAARRIVAPA